MNADRGGNRHEPAEEGRDLDRALTEAGDRWRATQPPPPDPEIVPGFSRQLRETVRATIAAAGASRSTSWLRPRIWAPVAALAATAAVLAVIVLPAALNRPDDQAGPGTGPPPSPTAPTNPDGVGRVGGTGSLLRNTGGETWLCPDSIMRTDDLPTSRAGCGSELHVIVTGVDEKWLVHPTTSGQAFSDLVKVEGTYRAGTLAVTKVDPFTPDPEPPRVEPPVPCPPPAGGWRFPYYGYTPDDPNNDPVNRLMEEVRGKPAQYTDVWEGHPEGVPNEGVPPSEVPYVMVMVVGTKGDVASTRAELGAIFPGNLCVHRVQYSASDLESIAERLRSGSATPIGVDPLVIENKVRVKVIALDPATNELLDDVGRSALIIDEPLLQWLD
jgi:hypothetical protein